MTFADAQIRVLDGHGKAPERDHLAAMGDVQVVERGPLQSIAGGGGAIGSASALYLLTWGQALDGTKTLSYPWALPVAFADAILEFSTAARTAESANALTSRDMSPPQA